jgi:predicted Zn-dependent protease
MDNIQSRIDSLLNKTKSSRENAIVYLAEEIKRRRLIVFVGAGCSVNAGLPSWGDLISDIQKNIHLKTNETDLLRIASNIEKNLGDLPFREEVVKRLTLLPTSLPLHQKLAQLDVNLFITTNYDQLLEDAFRNEKIQPVVVIRYQDIPSIDPSRKTIVKLHGDVNSTSAIVISSQDYLKYKFEHKPFVDWLNNKTIENTILFIGTSFTDQRLKDADEYVLQRFGQFRRNPCIFLRFPGHRKGVLEADYAVELNDFEILYEEFITKGFKVIVIKEYEEIPKVLDEVHNLVLQKKLQDNPDDLKIKLFLKNTQAEELKKELADLCDANVRSLCDKVWGNGKLPTQGIMKEQAQKLREYLNKHENALNGESKLQGFLTLCDAYLNLEKKGGIADARECFNRANEIFQEINNQSAWKNRLIRVSAKLLFFEGKTEEAMTLLLNSDDDKTINLWLSLLIDLDKLDEAYNFVATHEIKDPWRSVALYLLVIKGQVDKAEKVFQDFLKSSNAEESLSRICSSLADAYLKLAIISTGITRLNVFPEDMNSEGETLCERSIEYANKISHKTDLENDYFAYMSLVVKMKALYLLRRFKDADALAKDLIKVTPISRDVAEYVAARIEFLETDVVKSTIESLSRDYPEQSWALSILSFLQIKNLNDHGSAWETAKKVLEIASDEAEKERAAGIIFDIGNQINKQNEAQQIIQTYLSPASLWRKYLNAGYEEMKGQSERALQLISEIEAQNPSPHLFALCKYRRAVDLIKNNPQKVDYEKAEQLLLEAQRVYSDQPILEELLRAQVKLQNDVGAFETTEKLGKMGVNTTNVRYIKAITARNIGNYTESEKTWKELIKDNPHDSQLAYGYAELLAIQEKYDEALPLLDRFIQSNQDLNLKCLRLAVHILCSQDKEKVAFNKLDNCFIYIQGDPDLLMQYMNLGYQIEEEQKAHQALIRLEQLKDEGKISDQVFKKVSLDEIKDIIRRRYESIDKLCEQYLHGKALRHFFSSFFNISLYSDWAYKTLSLAFLPEVPVKRAQFTIYSTNGFRVEKNELVPIAVPNGIREIVIDYTALITLHQLGLIPKLTKQFNALYYPNLLHSIWDGDKQKYKQIQSSQEKIYRNLVDKFEKGRLESIELPASKSREIDGAFQFAETNNIPLVSAYIEKKEIPKEFSGTIFRFHQILTYLYEKGRLSESRFVEIKKLIKDQEDLVTKDISTMLNQVDQVVFDETTLELAERFELIDVIIEAGLKVIVEKKVLQNIQGKIREIEYSARISKWQKDLISLVNDTKVENKRKLFVSEHTLIRDDVKTRNLHVYDILAVETSQLAERKGLPLLSDDRFIQMHSAKSFGTDAFLHYLFSKEVISLQEYAEAFLKLCEWRYRFLIPTSDIIVYLAFEYKHNPLGAPLEVLIKYSNECMKDQGLFLGREPTIPPTLCGVKFYMQWVNVWIDALIKIWTDNNFDQGDREKISRQIFLRAFPPGPQGLQQKIRSNITAMMESSIIQRLFIGIIEHKNSASFKQLLDQAFESLGFSEEKRLETLIFFLRKGVKENIGKKGQELITRIMLTAFYGESRNIDERLIPILQDLGVEISLNKASGSSQGSVLSPIDVQRIVAAFSDRPAERSSIDVDDSKIGPLIFIPPDDEKSGGELLVLHDLIGADSLEIRKVAIHDMLKASFISLNTKKVAEERRDAVLSEEVFVWPLNAKEIRETLLKDFLYAQYIFRQLTDLRISNQDRQVFIRMALKSSLEPSIDSILSSLPLLLEDPFNREEVEKRVRKKFPEFDSLSDLLTWYLDNAYFVPYLYSKNIYEIVKDSIKNLSCKDILENTRQWLDSVKEDHLAWLLAMELILSVRADSKIEEQTDFTSEDFFKFLDEIFSTLLLADNPLAKVSPKADCHEALMQVIWTLRKELASYYLCYLDINMQSSFDDERKVLLAWWMAKKTLLSILKSCERLTTEGKTLYVSSILSKKQNDFSLMKFRRQFINVNSNFTSSRYLTINKSDLLSYAVCSLFLVDEREGIGSNKALKGLRFPKDALASKISGVILNKLSEDIITGNSQLLEGESSRYLRWTISLARSVPSFFRNYYGDALKFLGEKVGKDLGFAEKICEIAEITQAKDFLNSELPKIQEYINNNQEPFATLLISSLKVFLLSHSESEYPQELQIIKTNETILKQMCGFSKPLAFSNCMAFSEILLFLQSKRDHDWLPYFCKQFQEIDYEACEPEVSELIISYLIIFVLTNGDYSVLTPFLNAKKLGNRKIKDVVLKMSPVLESFLSYVPLNSRENYRRILNDLA